MKSLSQAKPSSLRLRTLVKFPSLIEAETGVRVERDGGKYTFGLHHTDFVETETVPDQATQKVVIVEPGSGDVPDNYQLISLKNIGEGYSGSYQPLDDTLTALSDLDATPGILVESAEDTFVKRSITSGYAVTVTNGDGVAGDISIAVTDPELVALGNLASEADKLPYFTGEGTASLADFTSAARDLLNDESPSEMRETLGLAIGTDVQAHSVNLDDFSNKTAPSGDVVGTSDAQTLTGKTISGSANNLSDIGNSSLVNSSITIAGHSVALGGSQAIAVGDLSSIADGTVVSNVSGSSAAPAANSITSVLDKLFGTAQGTIVYRGGSSWSALAPGSSGQFLKTLGAAANPAWDSIPGGGDMLASNNLSDLDDADTALTNLGGTTVGKSVFTSDAPEGRGALGVDILGGFRNKIINGDFDIWQRGTTFSTTAYTADRWQLVVGTGATCSVGRGAFSAGLQVGHASPRYYLTWARSTAGTAASVLQQSIEGVRTFEGRTVTVTFWAKASAGTDVAVDLVQIFGTGGSPSAAVYTATQVCSLTTSLQKFTFMVDVPSIAGKTLGSNDDDCLRLRFIRAHTSANPTTTVSLAHVSVVLGDATKEDDPSPPIDIGAELARCQRYYEQCTSDDVAGGFIGGANWFGSATGPMNIQATALFRVKKRAVPTVTGTIRGSSGNFSSLTPSMGATVFGVNNTMNVNAAAANTYVTTWWTADAEF